MHRSVTVCCILILLDTAMNTTKINSEQEGDAGAAVSDTEESEDDLPEPDLTAGNKDACILVVNCIWPAFYVQNCICII